MIKGIIGIDPGKSGGLCVYNGKDIVKAIPCPSSILDMADSVRVTLNNFEIEGISSKSIPVLIEHVHAFPTDSRSSSFKFGTNYGMWLGIFASFGLHVETVVPVVWMRKYGELPKAKAERKRYLKVLALSFFPDNKITLKTADAILIAKYGFEELEWSF